MALDNSSYDALQATYFTLQNHLGTVTLTAEHSPLIIKHEQLGELLESFDVEELEEQTKNLQGLHDQLDAISAICKHIDENIHGDIAVITDDLETIFDKINNIVL